LAKVRIFTSFDPENDQDLYEKLALESCSRGSGFEISARSNAEAMTDRWEERVRDRIRGVDEVIVICGEHTDTSPRVSAELRITQEECKPYFLLWGRRASMCTKPSGSRPADGMYSWTHEILQNQMIVTIRDARPREIPEAARRP
jgi:hypothetical protein